MRTNQSERDETFHKDTLLTEPHLVQLRPTRIDKDSMSPHYSIGYRLSIERRSIREEEVINECIKMKKRHQIHSEMWSILLPLLLLSNHTRVNLKQTLRFVSLEKSSKQEKRRWTIPSDENNSEALRSILSLDRPCLNPK